MSQVSALLPAAVGCYLNASNSPGNAHAQTAATGTGSAVDPGAFPGIDEADLERVRRHVGLASTRAPGQCLVDVSAGAAGTEIVVVNDDMPLLVEAVLTVVEAHGLTVSRIDHPVMSVSRDDSGTLTEIGAGPDRSTESWIYVVAVSSRGDVDVDALRSALVDVIARVGDVDRDALDMRGRLSSCGADCAVAPTTTQSGIAAVDRYEYSRLLDWFAGNHFVPLGYCRVSIDRQTTQGRGLWLSLIHI